MLFFFAWIKGKKIWHINIDGRQELMGSCGNLEMWSPDSVLFKYFSSLMFFSGKVKAKISGTLANQQGCLINFPFSNA